MISNLRHYLDGNKLIVKWNYVDHEPGVRVTCQIFRKGAGAAKREVLFADRGITLEKYDQMGGAVFDKPTVPAIIEVFDEAHPGEVQQATVRSDVRYRIEARTALEDVLSIRKESYGFLGLRTREVTEVVGQKLSASLIFPDTLSEEEIRKISPWVIRGRYVSSGDREETFFWHEDQFCGRQNDFPPVEVYVNDTDFRFEIVPEVEGTEYENLFEIVNEAEVTQPDAASRTTITEIDLGELKRKDENGLYEITCPYCLKAFSHNQALFRADVSSESLGYGPEADQRYAGFYEENNFQKPQSGTDQMGKVLNGDEIESYALADQPNRFLAYESGPFPENDVVVAVKDKKGNVTFNKICPHCHHSIPPFSGKFPMVFINMMGNTGSGKSVFLGRTVSMLRGMKLLPGYKLRCSINENQESLRYATLFDLMSGVIQPDSIPAEKPETPPVDEPQMKPVPQPAFESAPSSFSTGDATGRKPGAQGSGMGRNRSRRKEEPEASPVAGVQDVAAELLSTVSESTSVAAEFAASEKEAVQRAESFRAANEWQSALKKNKERSELMNRPEDDFQQMLRNTQPGYIEPCIYTLRNADEGIGLILAIFDYPGELLKKKTGHAAYRKYFLRLLDHTDGMIFLFDPMTLNRIRNLGIGKQAEFSKYTYQMSEKPVDELLRDNPSAILSFFEQQFCRLSPRSFPIVCAIAKGDALRDYLPQLDGNLKLSDMRFLDESNYALYSGRKGIDLNEIARNSEQAMQFVGDPYLKDNTGRVSEEYVWMCVSATGVAPKNGSLKGQRGNPVWMMAPLEWILYKMQENQSRN